MSAEPDRFLPLRPVEFQILVSLGQGPGHGYGILRDAEARADASAVPGLVTLYRALQRMAERGLVELASSAEAATRETGDERRRVYRITPLGSRVLRAEAARLSPLVRAALEAAGPSAAEDS